MASNEVRPNRVTALCAALQGIGGGLGWSVLPPLVQPISAELQLSHVGAPRVGAALGMLMPVGAAAQHGGFSGALAVLGAAHLAILIPARRLPETGTRGRATAQSNTELSRLAA